VTRFNDVVLLKSLPAQFGIHQSPYKSLLRLLPQARM
jgi:hypothetical protein